VVGSLPERLWEGRFSVPAGFARPASGAINSKTSVNCQQAADTHTWNDNLLCVDIRDTASDRSNGQ